MRRVGRTMAAVFVAVALVAGAGCSSDSDEDSSTEAPSNESSSEDTTTTTTEAPAISFDETVLAVAVIAPDDPWPNDGIASVESQEHDLDTIWPEADFPNERAAYVQAGFTAGQLALFQTPDSLTVSVAHLFDTVEGAETAFDLIEEFHRVPANMTLVFGIPFPDGTAVEELEVDLGDQSAAFIHRGIAGDAAVVVWRTGNLVQAVRSIIAPGSGGDEVLALAEAIAARTSSD